MSINRFDFDNIKEPLIRYRFNVDSISRKKKYRQKIISQILAKNYRLNKVTDVRLLNLYLKSNEYKSDLNIQKELNDLKNIFLSSKRIYRMKYLYRILRLKIKKYNRINSLIRNGLC